MKTQKRSDRTLMPIAEGNRKHKKIETRKMLLLLPVPLIPLLALAFYALGGGRTDHPAQDNQASGINLALPDAKFKSDTLSGKMAVYEQEEKERPDSSIADIASVAERLGFNGADNDPQAKAIQDRLARLQQELDRPYQTEPSLQEPKRLPVADPGTDKAVAKLEMLMQSMQQDSGAEDPEMKQLSGILQSIQEIQNPELAKLKYQRNGNSSRPDSLFRAIPAIIDGNQKALQGSVIKVKLLEQLVVDGQVIPKGHSVYGLANFTNQRLQLEIKNIRLGNLILPVDLTVFDQRDAMVGINAPEALLNEAVNSGVVNAAGSVSLPGFDLTTQLAGAGIDAARSLLSKKLKKIRQPLKSGYPLLLRDNTMKTKDIH